MADIGERWRYSLERFLDLLLRTTIVLLLSCLGCAEAEKSNLSTVTSKNTEILLTKEDALNIVIKHMKEKGEAPSGYELNAMQFDGRWTICAWKITNRDPDGTPRFMPGGFIDYDLNEIGEITMIAGGK